MITFALTFAHGIRYFRRAELAELVKFHYEDEVDENEDRLEADQVTMIRGILHMSDKTVAVSTAAALLQACAASSPRRFGDKCAHAFTLSYTDIHAPSRRM